MVTAEEAAELHDVEKSSAPTPEPTGTPT